MTTGLQLGRADVLRSSKNFVNKDRQKRHDYLMLKRMRMRSAGPECHCTDRPGKRRLEKGTGQSSTVSGPGRSAFSSTNIGAVSRSTLPDR